MIHKIWNLTNQQTFENILKFQNPVLHLDMYSRTFVNMYETHTYDICTYNIDED